ncbi:hypothetical protein QYF61_015639 [Mycteria americana]|uniref:Uncharacterized protein n=1 Tax=Mycteria americana TaxID=33587 RepID=A0AAN7S3Z5_MYCAM|nr:hypothetical protein QYF61_015639 [Mycteria americana]
MLLLMQPRIRLAFWAAHAHYQVMLSFSSTNTPKSFSSGLLSIHSLPSLYLCLGLPRPMCRTLHLALLNFMRFTWSHSSSLSRSLWMASFPSSVSVAPHSLLSSADLLRHSFQEDLLHDLARRSGYLSLLPPSVGFLFVFEFVQELLVHPGRPPGAQLHSSLFYLLPLSSTGGWDRGLRFCSPATLKSSSLVIYVHPYDLSMAVQKFSQSLQDFQFECIGDAETDDEINIAGNPELGVCTLCLEFVLKS